MGSLSLSTNTFPGYDSAVEELGITLSQVVHVGDEDEFTGSNVISILHEISDEDETELQTLSLNSVLSEGSSLSLNSVLSEGSSYSATVLSEAVQSHSLVQNENKVLLPSEIVGARSPSHETARKLVSAMKGSRAEQGIVLMSKLSVKWAEDVYDPPVTAESHTVRGHHRHRSKANKKDYNKNKHSKAKSSSRNSSDRRHAYHRSSSKITDPHLLRLQDFREKSSTLNKAAMSIVEDAPECAARAQELKCGGSFMGPLSPMHLPLAEAS
ncbi:uncharacterized protein LOC109728183 [Ananas comosus]|uniref:Uncharacterized protein LOC109728183 n=1 Tax=Ananas comosus TaxID=4615 RepID=A0A199W697_ANACO|nr:uncharacterized protein LOC109728183 [Ananas comosus]OAY85002.1 hypothetical protein ACMD2_08047 [Ananas comosus]